MARSLSYFWRGFVDGLPFVLVLAPFGILFGVVGTQAGLDLAQVMGFAILVIAGAAQFTTLQLMTENTPTVIAVLAGLAVNVRMAMYSASLAPYLGNAPIWRRSLAAYLLVDNAYALSASKFEARPEMTVAHRYSYYFGIMTLTAPVWYLATLIGALVGKSIPPEYALDFALPITFLAILGPALRTMAHVAAALTSLTLSLAMAFLPYNTGLFIAALVAIMVGARVELWMTPRGMK